MRELPFSVCDVELYEDMELLDGFSATATAALMQVGGAGADADAGVLQAHAGLVYKGSCQPGYLVGW